jgi:hypothetical protein
MYNKTAQMAMQYLFTYGFAILIASSAIGAMAYFGVLNPAILLPDKCTFDVTLQCIDFDIQQNQISFVIQSNAGRSMLIRNISISSAALGNGLGYEKCYKKTGNTILRNNAKISLDLNEPSIDGACTFRDTGRYKNKYNILLTHSWSDSEDIIHKISGELFAVGP